MGWIFLDEAKEESLTAAEWERIFLMVNSATPHAEDDIDPAHCPSCRNAHAIVLLEREHDTVKATAIATAMPATALRDAFMLEG